MRHSTGPTEHEYHHILTWKFQFSILSLIEDYKNVIIVDIAEIV